MTGKYRRTAALALAMLGWAISGPGRAAGLERLYILDCGVGMAGDVSRWSPGVNIGQAMPFVDNCYLLKHRQGWMLWDTGVADTVADLPDGLKPADPRAVRWYRPRTLAAQLAELQVAPAEIRYVAVSHSHPDHTGNLDLFPRATLLVQKAEYEWPDANNRPRFKAAPAATLLEGDRDVFGDGSVTLLATPGHTPGHQSLLVKLPQTGALLLSGDAVHFSSNWENRRVPGINADAAQTRASMDRLAEILAREKASLWINHDKAQRDTLKLSPEYYE